MNRFFSIPLFLIGLLSCEVLLQYHGWSFWRTGFDPAWGPALSTALGVLALVWWVLVGSGGKGLHRALYFALALMTSTVCLAGPLYHVAAPIIEAQAEKGHEDETRVLHAEALAESIRIRQAELSILLTNSETRRGWDQRIKEASARLEALENRRAELLDTPLSTALPWKAQAVVFLQAAALLLLQIGAAAFAGLLGQAAGKENFRATTTRTETLKREPKQKREAAPDVAGRVETVWQGLRAELNKDGATQRSVAEAFGVTPKDVSLLKNHNRRAEQGEETISMTRLEKLEQILEAK